jgi:hypothetical protein
MDITFATDFVDVYWSGVSGAFIALQPLLIVPVAFLIFFASMWYVVGLTRRIPHQ